MKRVIPLFTFYFLIFTFSLPAQTARLGSLPANTMIITNETDAAALAALHATNTVLYAALANEATMREAGDTAGLDALAGTNTLLRAALHATNTVLYAALTNEATMREAGDTAGLDALAGTNTVLYAALTNEAALREAGDTAGLDALAGTNTVLYAALTNEAALRVTHTNDTANPHDVTAAQIGAITVELDLAALRTYHYGSPDIVESPAEWFVFNGAGTITAFNYQAGRENVVIPWAIGGVPVTGIGANAFESSGIVSVIAPQTVTVIGSGAFFYCDALTSVSLPQATSIGDNAFSYCRSLASVSLPQAQTIGGNAFDSCFTLASVSLPQATAIGDYALRQCDSLASVSLPQAQTIGDYAFFYCRSLTAVLMGRNAPVEVAGVFEYITPPPTVYVTDPQATGWGAEWNGAPVVRLDLHGDKIYQAGELVATTGHVAQAIAAIPEPDLSGKADVQDGVATNLSTHGWLQLPQTAATNLVLRMWASNDVIYASEVYQ